MKPKSKLDNEKCSDTTNIFYKIINKDLSEGTRNSNAIKLKSHKILHT